MSIKLCQAANSVVTPLDDAQLYSWVANRAVGVVAGCVVTSAGTNQLAISAGWGIVQGHVFTIGAETISAAVAPSGTVNGRLLIRIDTSDTVTPVEFITQAATPLPALTQEDIDGSGSIYEMALATYTVGTISISGLANVAPTADKRQTAANTPIADAGGLITATNVEGALQELAGTQKLNTLLTTGLTYTGCTYNSGGYVKIGNLVVVNIRVSLTADVTNPLVISGLPAPVVSNNANYVPADVQILLGACYAGVVYAATGGDPIGSVRAYGTFTSGQSMLINAVYVAA